MRNTSIVDLISAAKKHTSILERNARRGIPVDPGRRERVEAIIDELEDRGLSAYAISSLRALLSAAASGESDDTEATLLHLGTAFTVTELDVAAS